jgi:arsenate reductase
MAEGLLRAIYGDRYEVYSAGTQVTAVNPYVIRAMAEIGIDLSNHRSKHLNEFANRQIDIVVTVCDNAKASCPYFSGGIVIHHSFADPSQFMGTDAEIMAGVRRVRDEIKIWIEELFANDTGEPKRMSV